MMHHELQRGSDTKCVCLADLTDRGNIFLMKNIPPLPPLNIKDAAGCLNRWVQL
ncbi:hypothetical protein PAMP_012611 [Pampus punctatissimus]